MAVLAIAGSLSSEAFAAVKKDRPATKVNDWDAWNRYFDKTLTLKGKQGGYALIVMKNGRRVIERSEGWARAPWERETPAVKMTTDTPVYLASASKPIVAVCFLKAWELKGKKFSLDDPFWAYSPGIRKIFPMASDKARKITFRHILTHNTGLSHADWEDARSLQNSVHIMLSKPMDFEPGARHDYNNGNYMLLRVLVEEISGMEFTTFLKTHINDKLGIKTLGGVNPNPKTLHYIPNTYDCGYTLEDTFHGNNNWQFGAFGGFGSADDLAKFMVGLRQYKILSRKTTEQMYDEALGWPKGRVVDGPSNDHHGFWTWDGRKATAAMERLPNGIDVVAVSNSDPGILGGFIKNAYNYAAEHGRASSRGSSKPALVYFRRDGLVSGSYLDGNGKPAYGYMEKSVNVKPARDRRNRPGKAVKLGPKSMLLYRIPYFPEREFSFVAWVKPEGLPTKHLAQVFCAWSRSLDDPLRVVLEGTKLYARVEAGSISSTEGVEVQEGKWIHIAATKEGPTLKLYVNGKKTGSAEVPDKDFTLARDFALGANPQSLGPENFTGSIDDFALYARALSAQEIALIYSKGLSLSLDK